MKQSIKKIFINLNTYLFFVLFVTFISMMFTLEKQLSFEKVDNLRKQQKIISSLTTLKKDDIELALIQFNGKSTQLHQEIEKLKSIYKYNYTDKLIFNNDIEYLNDLDKLSELTTTFNEAAHQYYVKDNNKERDASNINLKNAFFNINTHINDIMLKTMTYNQEKFSFYKIATIVMFIIVFISTLYFRKKLFSIHKDVEYLYQIDKSKRDYSIYTLEADAIAMRMNRK
ncbi:MAG: GGDEF domain-containing protein, partial [Campylobacterota bacterium]|nr:GGDEF domain-containing protein [Campylobacterota bacterium]